jgi:hypothetical protein
MCFIKCAASLASAVVPLVEVMHAVLVNGVSLLLVRTGWWYHRHKKGCHRFTLRFWFFKSAFVNDNGSQQRAGYLSPLRLTS